MEKETTTGVSKKNIFALFFGVLLRPKATFVYLKDNSKRAWWLPAILILLLIAAPVIAASRTATSSGPVMGAAIGGFVVEPGMSSGAIVNEKFGAEVPFSTEAPATNNLNLLQLAGKVLGAPAAWLLWGAALYLASVFLGRSSSFGQMARLAVWTWLPYGVRGLVQTVYIVMTGAPIVNAGLSGFVINQALASPIAPGPGQLALASILGGVDAYLIWHLILLSVGLMAFTGLKYRKALTTVLAIWLVFALLSIVPAIFGGMLGGVTNNPAPGGGLG